MLFRGPSSSKITSIPAAMGALRCLVLRKQVWVGAGAVGGADGGGVGGGGGGTEAHSNESKIPD